MKDKFFNLTGTFITGHMAGGRYALRKRTKRVPLTILGQYTRGTTCEGDLYEKAVASIKEEQKSQSNVLLEYVCDDRYVAALLTKSFELYYMRKQGKR